MVSIRASARSNHYISELIQTPFVLWNTRQMVGLGFMEDKLNHTWLEVPGTGMISLFF